MGSENKPYIHRHFLSPYFLSLQNSQESIKQA
jgi:hypothetical protein